MASEDRKIFIGGITFGVDQNVIREDFMRFGEIEDVYLPTDRDTGKLRGFAFITYRESRDAHEACGAMHGRDYHGRQITVNVAKPRGPREEGKGGGPPRGSYGDYARDAGGGGGKGGAYSYTRPQDYDRGLNEQRRYDERGEGSNSGGGDRGGDRDRDGDDDDRFTPRYSHGHSYDGSGRYGEKDPRGAQAYYD